MHEKDGYVNVDTCTVIRAWRIIVENGRADGEVVTGMGMPANQSIDDGFIHGNVIKETTNEMTLMVGEKGEGHVR
jgi:hypothetical protein